MQYLKLQYVYIFFFFVVCLQSVTAFSQDTEENEPKPVLLMLFLESSKIFTIEQSLRLELELELESHDLAVEKSVSFWAATLTEKINEIRTIAIEQKADAVLWVEPNGKDMVTLQLVVIAPGQSTVSSVNAHIEDNNIGELVIAAKELLNRIYITMKTHPAPMLKSQTGKEIIISPASPKGPRYFIGFGAELINDLYPKTAFASLVNGQILGRRKSRSGLFIESSFAVLGAPPSKIRDGKIRTFAIRPGMGLGYMLESNVISWGPALLVQLIHQWAHISLYDGDRLFDRWWDLRFVPSADILFHLSNRISLLLRTGLGIHINQKMFKRVSDGSTIYSTPYLDGSITVNIIFNLN